MKFWEAMKALEEGKKVRKSEWDPKYYLVKDKNSGNIVDEENNLHADCKQYDDWELYEEPVKQYNFLEAVHLMKKGNVMRRECWRTGFIHSDGLIFKEKIHNKFQPIVDDIVAKDWVVVE